MYLFHHCLVYVYGRWLTIVDWPIWLEFSLLTVGAAMTVIVLHEYVIRRFGWARLLFNGKTDIDAIRSKRVKQDKRQQKRRLTPA
jgi:hypothetical protein